jgi:DNA-binding NarL/FixJ family response regulator
MNDETLRILLIDDHPLFRAGLKHLLDKMGDGVEIDEADNLAQGLERLSGSGAIDLVLVDLMMPGMEGFDGISTLRREAPDAPIVVISVKDRAEDVRRAMDAGAVGYVPKSSSPDVMIHALKLVLSGGMYLPPNVLDGPARESAGARRGNGLNMSDGPLANLTRRQRDVLNLLIEGMSNKEIANVLGLSAGTVKIHVSSIFKVLNVTNRTLAVITANQLLAKDTAA